MLFLLAWRNLWRNRRRTLITMASVIFAVLFASSMKSLHSGSLEQMERNIVSFYTGYIQIHKNGYWDDRSIDNSLEASEALHAKVKAHPEVNWLVPRLECFALAASEAHSKGVMVVGIDPEQEPRVTGLDKKLVQGEYLHGDDQAVLLVEGMARYLKLDVGDTLVLLGQGYHGASAAGKYPVRGLLSFGSEELNNSLIFLPLKESQWLFSAENRITSWVLLLAHRQKYPGVTNDLALSLGEAYEVINWETMVPKVAQIIEAEQAQFITFQVVLYTIIAFGIFGTILMMTMERTYEFGVMVAIGMKKIRLATSVILENLFISLFGSIGGLLISIPIVLYFHFNPIPIAGELGEAYANYGYEPIFYFSVNPYVFYSQAIIVLVVFLILSFYPLLKITRLVPVKAMRD